MKKLLKFNSREQKSSRTYGSDALFIVKLGLTLCLTLVYLLMTLIMLLFNKICFTALTQKTEGNLNVHESHKRLF